MAFQPGQSGNPAGRTPGSKNKKTSIAFEEFFNIYTENLDRLRTELAKLEGKEFVSEMRGLSDFVFARQARLTSTNFNIDEPAVREVFIVGGKEFEL